MRSHPRPGSNSDGLLVSHTLRAEGFDASEDGTDRGTPIVAAPLTKGSAARKDVNPPGRHQEDDTNIVAFHTTQDPISDPYVSMPVGFKSGGMGDSHPAAGVRRLTPTECERLQGFPDGWTQLGDTPDSPRYSGLGDAVTVSVAEWIGRRLRDAG